MKINRNTAFICVALIVISCVCLFIFGDNNALLGVFTGIFTGFIVSFVISIINYLYEREKLFETIDNNLSGIYINIKTMSNILDDFLPLIYNSYYIQDYSIKNVVSLSSLNIDYSEKMNLGLFSPFFKSCKKAGVISKLNDYKSIIYNFKRISIELDMKIAEYNLMQSNKNNAQMQGMTFNINDKYIDDIKNYINIRTAKFHEYTESSVIALEKMAKEFYTYCKKKSWDDVKKDLTLQVNEILMKEK